MGNIEESAKRHSVHILKATQKMNLKIFTREIAQVLKHSAREIDNENLMTWSSKAICSLLYMLEI